MAKLKKNRNINHGSISVLKLSMVLTILTLLLLLIALFSCAVGSAGYSVMEIMRALFSSDESTVKIIILNLRLPRVILAVLIGAALSVSGALLQAVMRNPLADPGTIGVSAGAGTDRAG